MHWCVCVCETVNVHTFVRMYARVCECMGV